MYGSLPHTRKTDDYFIPVVVLIVNYLLTTKPVVTIHGGVKTTKLGTVRNHDYLLLLISETDYPLAVTSLHALGTVIIVEVAVCQRLLEAIDGSKRSFIVIAEEPNYHSGVTIVYFRQHYQNDTIVTTILVLVSGVNRLLLVAINFAKRYEPIKNHLVFIFCIVWKPRR